MHRNCNGVVKRQDIIDPTSVILLLMHILSRSRVFYLERESKIVTKPNLTRVRDNLVPWFPRIEVASVQIPCVDWRAMPGTPTLVELILANHRSGH